MNKIGYTYLRKNKVAEILGGITTRTVERLVADGRLPKPYRLSQRISVWRSDELQEFMDGLKPADAEYCKSPTEKDVAAYWDKISKDACLEDDLFEVSDDEEEEIPPFPGDPFAIKKQAYNDSIDQGLDQWLDKQEKEFDDSDE